MRPNTHFAVFRGQMLTATALLLLTAQSQSAEQHSVDVPRTAHQNQAGLTFSPDGKTAYWFAWDGVWGGDATSVRTIYFSRHKNDGWTRPKAMPFSGTYPDDDPYVSPDGEWLYFVSERPVDQDDESADGDIWRYRLSGDHKLERLTINSDAAEYSPVIIASGALYFASARAGGFGRGDIYVAQPDGAGFHAPSLLSDAINSGTGEWNVWVSADESVLIFEASSRPTNLSIPGDLYISTRGDGDWTPATSLRNANSTGSDLLPRLSPNGQTMFYTTAEIGGHAKIASIPWPPD